MGTLFFILYLALVIMLFFSKHKKQALIYNVFACIAGGLYLLFEHGYAGSVAYTAAGLGSLFQLYTMSFLSKTDHKKLLKIKLIGCVLFATIGIAAVYQTPSDLYLVFAIIICRSGEIMPKNHQVKLGYTFAEALWLLYAADQGFVPLFFIHLGMTALGTTVLIKHYADTLEDWKKTVNMELLLLTQHPALARIRHF